MNTGNKSNEPGRQGRHPGVSTDYQTNNNNKQEKEGEHFEIDILRLIKVKSRHVNNKVIIAILLVLLFVWLIIKL
jgi:hypothetical protein